MEQEFENTLRLEEQEKGIQEHYGSDSSASNKEFADNDI